MQDTQAADKQGEIPSQITAMSEAVTINQEENPTQGMGHMTPALDKQDSVSGQVMTLTPAATDNHADNPKQITAPRQAAADN